MRGLMPPPSRLRFAFINDNPLTPDTICHLLFFICFSFFWSFLNHAFLYLLIHLHHLILHPSTPVFQNMPHAISLPSHSPLCCLCSVVGCVCVCVWEKEGDCVREREWVEGESASSISIMKLMKGAAKYTRTEMISKITSPIPV